jgi:tRNA dimethylallyltransferase
VAAARLHGHDRQRLIRALEVVEGTGRPLSHWQEQGRQGAALNGVQVERMFVSVARDALYARAEARFDRMLAAGALDEVAALPAYDADLPVMKAIGVPELLGVIRGQWRMEDAVVAAKTATRHYIKRQLTWFRGQMTQWPAVPPP